MTTMMINKEAGEDITFSFGMLEKKRKTTGQSV